MNYKKIILVGCISAFVAFLTSIMGVAGTIIGSVISSMLYNMLTEALEKPVGKATFSEDFEWDIAYIFPIAVIALIQLLLIFALMGEMGILPYSFTNAYLSLQSLANNNLYRLLGIALIVISAYPLVLKPEFVKKEHGIILVFVGIIFLARGFVDLGNSITDIYDAVFIYYDLPIAIIALVLLIFVMVRILMSARNSQKEHKTINRISGPDNFKRTNVQRIPQKQEIERVPENNRSFKKYKKTNGPANEESKHQVSFKNHVDASDVSQTSHNSSGINKSSEKIHFESNDLLDDYKK